MYYLHFSYVNFFSPSDYAEDILGNDLKCFEFFYTIKLDNVYQLFFPDFINTFSNLSNKTKQKQKNLKESAV